MTGFRFRAKVIPGHPLWIPGSALQRLAFLLQLFRRFLPVWIWDDAGLRADELALRPVFRAEFAECIAKPSTLHAGHMAGALAGQASEIPQALDVSNDAFHVLSRQCVLECGHAVIAR